MSCRACGSALVAGEVTLHETMFQTWEPFGYFECGGCGCLQIRQVPDDLGRHYRDGYYSFVAHKRNLRKWLKARALYDLCGGFSPIGRALNLLGLSPPEAAWLRVCRVTPQTRILDVGCGGGARLLDFAQAGLRSLAGVDPFAPETREIAPGVIVHKAGLGEMAGQFDLVMFHHSLEHVADPQTALRDAERVLAPGGTVLVRVPVMGKWAWRHYGRDWVQLDPPRHLCLFTERSMAHLAAACGLRVSRVVYDSSDFQFVQSERVRRLRAEREGAAPDDIPRVDANELNAASDGDQACFILTR